MLLMSLLTFRSKEPKPEKASSKAASEPDKSAAEDKARQEALKAFSKQAQQQEEKAAEPAEEQPPKKRTAVPAPNPAAPAAAAAASKPPAAKSEAGSRRREAQQDRSMFGRVSLATHEQEMHCILACSTECLWSQHPAWLLQAILAIGSRPSDRAEKAAADEKQDAAASLGADVPPELHRSSKRLKAAAADTGVGQHTTEAARTPTSRKRRASFRPRGT